MYVYWLDALIDCFMLILMLGGHPGLNSTHVRPYSLNLEGAVPALSYVPIISPFSLRMYGCLILTAMKVN
jgi:hypothetical protein